MTGKKRDDVTLFGLCSVLLFSCERGKKNTLEVKSVSIYRMVVIVCVPFMVEGHTHTCSKPGSLWYGFSVIRDWMEMRTDEMLWAGLHAGPVHVLQQFKRKYLLDET